MLIANLLPLLTRYALTFDLISGPDGTVTLTIIPRKAEGTTQNLQSGEIRPISITASAQEIDAELERGTDGALGQLIASRKALADQLAEQHQAAETARAAAAAAAKAKAAAAAKPPAPAVAKTQATTGLPPEAKPDEPASLF